MSSFFSTAPQQASDSTGLKKLRCALIGCGGVSLHYLRVYRELPWVQVDYCVDVELSKAQEASEIVSAHQATPARVATDYRDCLTDEVDVVIINTPNHLHVEHTLAALAADKHVLLQKPVATTLEEGLTLLRAAEAKRGMGIKAGLYMSYLEHPAIQELIAMSRSGIFGDVTQMHGRLMHTGGMDWSRQRTAGNGSWRGSVRQTGGGAFIQLAVHHLRLFRLLSGQTVTAVNGFTSNLHCPGIEGEDTASAVFSFASGGCATLNVSWCSSGEELSVHGTEGSATYLDNTGLTVNAKKAFRGRSLEYFAGTRQQFSFPPVDTGDANSPFNQHSLFLNAVRTGADPPVTLRAGVEDMAVISSFYEAVRTGRTISVPSVEP